MNDHAESSQSLGPYEQWMFDFGNRYDLPKLFGRQKIKFFSCIAEFVVPFEIDPAGARSFIADTNVRGNSERFPLFWTVKKDDLNSVPEFVPKFIPFIFKVEQCSVTEISSGSFGGGLTGFTTRIKAGFQASQSPQFQKFSQTVKAETSDVRDSFQETINTQDVIYRVNYPIAVDTLKRPVPANSDLDVKEVAEPNPKTENKELNGADEKKVAPKDIVICAIIDDGIPFAHGNFRQDDGTTRVDYCWSQGAISEDDGEVLFGREFTGEQIKKLLVDNDFDETEVYREAGLLAHPGGAPMPLDRMSSHGAHTLDLMAGSWAEDSHGPDPTDKRESDKIGARIIAVDLPSATTWDTSGFGKDMFVLSAVHYIFKRADELADKLGIGTIPLVLNFSYGLSGGPHDGSSILEAAIDELVEARRKMAPTAVVMPSGNLFLNSMHAVLTEEHFEKSAKNGSNEELPEAELTWLIQPNDGTSSFLEIWLPENFVNGDFSFTITSPEGSVNEIGDILVGPKDHKELVGRSYFQQSRGGRWQALFAVVPTDVQVEDDEQKKLPSAPAGEWKIKIKKLGDFVVPNTEVGIDKKERPGGIECWIQRDEEFGQGNTQARQSYIKDAPNDLYWKEGQLAQTDSILKKAKVRRFGSINGLATGKTSLIVGGYISSNKQASIYSSAGSLRKISKRKTVSVNSVVDLSAVTDRSQWLSGVQAAGTRSGVSVTLRGTSAAAPQVARRLAKAFENPNENSSKTYPTHDKDNYLSLLGNMKELIEPVEHTRAHPKSKDRVGALLLLKRKPKVERRRKP